MKLIRRLLLLSAVIALSVAVTGCQPEQKSPQGAEPGTPETGAQELSDQAELEGTSWRLVGWSAEGIGATDFEITLSFEDGKLTGRAPVNSYGGDAVHNAGVLDTGDIAQTLMAGEQPAMDAEDAYMTRLNQAERYTFDGDTLRLSDGAGNELLVFERTDG